MLKRIGNEISKLFTVLYYQLHLLTLIRRAGKHDGWEETAWLGLEMSIEELAKRKVKVVINGGCLNPAGLAAKVANLVCGF
jgi:hypothetical protein